MAFTDFPGIASNPFIASNPSPNLHLHGSRHTPWAYPTFLRRNWSTGGWKCTRTTWHCEMNLAKWNNMSLSPRFHWNKGCHFPSSATCCGEVARFWPDEWYYLHPKNERMSREKGHFSKGKESSSSPISFHSDMSIFRGVTTTGGFLPPEMNENYNIVKLDHSSPNFSVKALTKTKCLHPRSPSLL